MRLEKVRSMDFLPHLCLVREQTGCRIVLAHGCFDLLHIGHIKHLQAAKEFGEVLVVTLTPDRLINKGPGRPVFSEGLRAEAVAALECVDYVVVNNSPTAVDAILVLRPNVFVKGSEYADNVTPQLEEELKAVEFVGGRIEHTREVEYHSTNLLKGPANGV
jgi:rfaE bifunctional protein nucleotidyltransferase chain/domain